MIKDFFLSRFAQADFIEQNKARIFLYYSFLMIVLLAFIPLGYMVLEMPEKVIRTGTLGAVGIGVLVLASLTVLRTGRLRAAIGVYALPTVLIIFVVRLLNTASMPETAFTAYIFYMPYMIVFVAVFGQRWQVPAVTLVFALNNVIAFLMVRGSEGAVGMGAATGFINGTIGILITGVSSVALVTIMDFYARRMRSDVQASAAKMREIESVMGTVRDGLNVGDTLVSEAQSMEAGLGTINAGLDASMNRLAALSEDIGAAKRSNDEIVGAAANLGRAGESLRTVAVQASAAVNEMTASIQGMASVSERSRESVTTLVASINSGEDAATQALVSMQRIAGNADSLMSVVDVITSVAGQTNLLAMNAAIEAAHAGELGKGFAVVAEEIRRLAEQTEENIQAITTGLRSFIDDMGTASVANEGINRAFGEIGERARQTTQAFDEILTGLRELSAGTSEIDRSVTAVVDSAAGMTQSIRLVDTMVAGNNAATDAIGKKAGASLADLQQMLRGFNDILAQAGKLRQLGQKSGSCMNDMDAAMQNLNKEA